MNIVVIVVAVVAVVIAQIIISLLLRKKDTSQDTAGLLLQQISDFRREVDQKLGESSRTIHDSVKTQLSESTRIVKEVTEGLTKLDETNRQVITFADQLKHLQDILQNPKQRGVLGEFFLETVLQDVLPVGTYKTQYEFKNGEKVDAAIFVKKHIVPVDAKFSLENYNRIVNERDPNERVKIEKVFINDLKMRIKETSKYIRPEEGTTDFAFMFIPSEGIYYDLLSNKVGATNEENNLIQRAYTEYKVIIVSPTTFVAYLQTVLQGLKSLQIEEQAKNIQKRVLELGKHLKGYEEYHGKLGNALSVAVGHYNNSGKEFLKLDKDILRIAGESNEFKVEMLDRPQDA